jgi:hypothetical protein
MLGRGFPQWTMSIAEIPDPGEIDWAKIDAGPIGRAKID